MSADDIFAANETFALDTMEKSKFIDDSPRELLARHMQEVKNRNQNDMFTLVPVDPRIGATEISRGEHFVGDSVQETLQIKSKQITQRNKEVARRKYVGGIRNLYYKFAEKWKGYEVSDIADLSLEEKRCLGRELRRRAISRWRTFHWSFLSIIGLGGLAILVHPVLAFIPCFALVSYFTLWITEMSQYPSFIKGEKDIYDDKW